MESLCLITCNLHYEKFADGTIECIEDQIPFELPGGWAWSKINNIAFVTKLAGFEYSKYIAPTLCEEGIPLFKGKNVQDSKIIYEFESFIPESISDELSRSQITRKCILTPYVGTIGNIGIHDKVGKFHLGSNVGKIELYNSSVVLMEEYVVTYLKSSFGYKQLTKHMKATAQASISIEAIRDVYIPIPPENEQQRMWSAISESLTLIETIESYECDIADIVKLAKAKILDLAIRGKLVPQNPDDEPASVLLERIRSEKDELIKQGKIKRDKKESVIFKGEDNSYYEKFDNGEVKCLDNELPFDIPESWRWCRLKDLFNVCSAKRVLQSEWKKEGIPFYRAREIVKLSNDGYVDNDLYISLDHFERLQNNYGVPQAGDLMVTGVGTIGKVYIVKSQDVFYYKDASVLCFENCFQSMIPKFAKMLMESTLLQTQIHSQTYGNTVDTITISTANDYLCVLPPLNQQQRIVEFVEKIYTFIESIEKSLA